MIRRRRSGPWRQLGAGLVTGASDDDPSGIATYGQAFLAVDRLVERYSAERLRELFRRAGDSDSRLRAVDARSAFAGLFARRGWNAVFPVDYRDFVAEFQADLKTAR